MGRLLSRFRGFQAEIIQLRVDFRPLARSHAAFAQVAIREKLANPPATGLSRPETPEITKLARFFLGLPLPYAKTLQEVGLQRGNTSLTRERAVTETVFETSVPSAPGAAHGAAGLRVAVGPVGRHAFRV